MFYCNICFTSLRPGDHATASTCGHIFCRCCFAKVLEQRQCHVCSTVRNTCIIVSFQMLTLFHFSQSLEAIVWKDHTIPAGIQNPQDQLLLIGYSLENCISLCLAGIQFKCRQDELYAKLRLNKVQQRMHQADGHYKKKIVSMNQGYADMKQKLEILEKEKRDMEGDIAELREKYGQKAKEAHSLRQQASGGMQTRHPGTNSGSQIPNNNNTIVSMGGAFQRSISPHHRAVTRTLSTPVYSHSSPSALMRSNSPYNHPLPGNNSDYSQRRSTRGIYGQAAYDSPMEMQGGHPVLQQVHAPGQLPNPSPSITPAKRRLGASPLAQYQQRTVYSQPMMSQLGLPPPASQRG